MTRRQYRSADPRLADLAALVQSVARAIAVDVNQDPEVIDLTATEMSVMRYVNRDPGPSPTAVAAAIGLQRSNLSRVLRDLEAKGMITKTADDLDGRQTRLHTTALAAVVLQRIRARGSRLLGSIDIDWGHVDTALTLLAALDEGLAASTRTRVAAP